MKVQVEFEFDLGEWEAGYGVQKGETSLNDAIENAVGGLLEYTEGVTNAGWEIIEEFPTLTVPTAVTVINPDGDTECLGWQPEGDDIPALSAAGITSIDNTIADDQGLYGVSLTIPVADKLRDWQATGPWNLEEEPMWAVGQRGEGAIWALLPSGTWIGIAPIDLEKE